MKELVISHIRLVISLILTFLFVCQAGTMAGETSLMKGRVTDSEGKPVEDAVIFIYRDNNTRREPDFMSPKSDKEGRFGIPLPPGRYWAVARVRSGEGIGPLLTGGKHSGEPVEIEVEAGRDLEKDFVVADIREVARMSKKTKEDVIKISGRILDRSGKPVKMAYAIANRNTLLSGMPDYLSGWTDDTGRYALYLPRGIYFIGAAASFPPGRGNQPFKEVTVKDDKTNFDIVVDQSLNAPE